MYRSGVKSFLEWLTATAKLPFTVEFKVKVSSLLMSSLYWKESIFNKSSSAVSKTNVEV